MRGIALAAEQLVDARQHLDLGSGRRAFLEELPKPAAREAARLHDDLVYPPPGDFSPRLLDTSKHLKPRHSRVLERGIVIEEADDHVGMR